MTSPKDINSQKLVYLATPYSRFPGGIDVAYQAACALAGKLLLRGFAVFSPIAHTHGIAIHCGIDPLDHSIWLSFDAAMMAKADAIIVAKMEGWEDSFGIAHEIDVFRGAGKPVYYLDPQTLEIQ